MSTTALVSGPNTLTQNTVYALPGRAKVIFSDKVLEVSNTTNSGFVAISATTTTPTLISATFVRSTTADAKVYVSNS